MMPGGSAEAYKHIQAIVEKVAAQVRCHSCCLATCASSCSQWGLAPSQWTW